MFIGRQPALGAYIAREQRKRVVGRSVYRGDARVRFIPRVPVIVVISTFATMEFRVHARLRILIVLAHCFFQPFEFYTCPFCNLFQGVGLDQDFPDCPGDHLVLQSRIRYQGG